MRDKYGAIIQGDYSRPNISLVFTGDEFRDGLSVIEKVLRKNTIKASFFVTGRFLEDKKTARLIQKMIKQGHYVGPHSDQHLLYAPWENRDSLLLTKDDFVADLQVNIRKLRSLGMININQFIPPYEWYNQFIVDWSKDLGLEVYNFTPGLRTPADYTYPEMGSRYLSSDKIMTQLLEFETKNSLNGVILLIHIGTDSRRTDKFYNRLEELINNLQTKKYNLVLLEKI